MLAAVALTQLLLVLILVLLPKISSWAEWNYTVQWSENPAAIESAITQWTSVWDSDKYAGNADPPRARRGHSLHIVKTDERSEYGGDSYIFMFGGRDNDQVTVQIPKTYNIETVSKVNFHAQSLFWFCLQCFLYWVNRLME